MTVCQRCNSTRIVSINAHCSDMCSVSINNQEVSCGYVPYDMGIGGSDDVEFDLCLNCGQQQGTWPISESKLERKANGTTAKQQFKQKQKQLLTQHADVVTTIANSNTFDVWSVFDLLITIGNDDPERIAAGVISLIDVPYTRALGETIFGKFEEWEHWDTLSALVEYNDEGDDDDEE